MSDVVTCKAILSRDENGFGHLWLAMPPDWSLRSIDVRPVGTPKSDIQRPQWEYEIKGDRLHLHPSLLCLDSKFHTAYNWDCEFIETKGDQYDSFQAANPEITIK